MSVRTKTGSCLGLPRAAEWHPPVAMAGLSPGACPQLSERHLALWIPPQPNVCYSKADMLNYKCQGLQRCILERITAFFGGQGYHQHYPIMATGNHGVGWYGLFHFRERTINHSQIFVSSLSSYLLPFLFLLLLPLLLL